MADYTATKKSSQASIRAKGLAIQIQRIINGTIDDITGKVPQTTATYDGYGVVVKSSITYPPNSIVKVGDKQTIVPAYGLECVPQAGDKLIMGGLSELIVLIDPVAPSGDPIIFNVYSRK